MKTLTILLLITLYGCSSAPELKPVSLPTSQDKRVFLDIMKTYVPDSPIAMRLIDRCSNDYEKVYKFISPDPIVVAEFCIMVMFEFAEVTHNFKEKSDEFYSDLMRIKEKRQLTDPELAAIAYHKAEYLYNQARQAWLYKHNRSLAQQEFDMTQRVFHWYTAVLETAYSKIYYSTEYNHLFQRNYATSEVNANANNMEMRLYEDCELEYKRKSKAGEKGLRYLRNRCEILKRNWEDSINKNQNLGKDSEIDDWQDVAI